MLNQLFQDLIFQMADVIDGIIGIIDINGLIISCTQVALIGECRQDILNEFIYITNKITFKGYTYKPIIINNKIEYFVFVEGEDIAAANLTKLFAVLLDNIQKYYDEKYNKSLFIKNIINNNIPACNIYNKSIELCLSTDVFHIVFLIKFPDDNKNNPCEMVQSMFPDKNNDYVISFSEQEIIFVKELTKKHNTKEIEKTAKQIVDTLLSGYHTKVKIGIGTMIYNIEDLAQSFKEAQTALEISNIFTAETNIIYFEKLGFYRLIYQLPTAICEVFLKEVFQNETLNSLDSETLMTIQCFFENNLNLSETSRKLMVHRNIMVYRLEKIRNLARFDLCKFEQAMIIKIALMVKKHLTTLSV